MEQIVVVDNQGRIKRVSGGKRLAAGENTAVELVMVYLPRKKQVVLFNRGVGASDMHDRWALESGKVNVEDLRGTGQVRIGAKLFPEAYKQAAIREFREEFNFDVQPEALEWVDEFHMPSKQIYFTLLALALEEEDLNRLSPNQSEVDLIGRFTLDEFEINEQLGDAIEFRKAAIIAYLQRVFGENA